MPKTISDQIRRDVTSRLGSGRGLPADLTLTALSRHYGVSPTPVREAIRDLVAEGILIKRGNGRVEINKDRACVDGEPSAGPTFEPTNRSADLEASLAAEVIGLSLRGKADYLREESTAARLGVGRTALRQALSRLAGRGLIVHVPRCGWRIRTFDEADLTAFLEMREALELKALELARPHLVEAELRRLLAGNDEDERSPRLDNDLHEYLVQKSGNPYIRDFFDRHGGYYTTLFNFAAPKTSVVRDMARQHRDILQAMIDRNWPWARRALAEHIRTQHPIVKDLLRLIGQPSPPLEST